jgi:hypothetical protein
MRFKRVSIAVLVGLVPGFVLAACDRPIEFTTEDTARTRRDANEIVADAYSVRPAEPVLPPVDIELTLPFGSSAVVPIEFVVSAADLDLVLNVDTTGSFDEEIDQLQNSFIATILPELRRSVSGIAIGVTKFQDYDFGSFGGPGDVPYLRLSSITTDFSITSAAIARLDNPIGGGGDLPESGYESLYQIATGAGQVTEGETLIRPWSSTMRAPGGGSDPGVGFREHSVRAVIHATDATSHEGSDYGINAHSSGETIAALLAREIRVIGVVTEGEPMARQQLESLALVTGAVGPPNDRNQCPTGIRGTARPPLRGVCPLVFDIDTHGGGLNEAIVQSIEALLASVSYDEAHGEALDDRYGLVHAIEAVSATATPPARTPTRVDERQIDGIPDTFRAIDHGVTLRFEAHLENDVLMPDDYDRRVTLTLVILGEGVAVATRTVRVLIPRRTPMDAGPRDAGVDANTGDTNTVDAFAEPPDAGSDADITDAAMDDTGADAPSDDASDDATTSADHDAAD